MKHVKKVFLKITVIAILVVLADQVTKFFVEKNLPEIVSHNTGIAFGIDVGGIWTIVVANVILMGIIVYAAKKELQIKSSLTQFFLSMVLGGGIGNLIDRIFKGSVTDFIAIWIYPSFNIADICISVGILGIIIFFNKVRK